MAPAKKRRKTSKKDTKKRVGKKLLKTQKSIEVLNVFSDMAWLNPRVFKGACGGVGEDWSGPAGSHVDVSVTNSGDCDVRVSLSNGTTDVGSVTVPPDEEGSIGTKATKVNIRCTGSGDNCEYDPTVTFS